MVKKIKAIAQPNINSLKIFEKINPSFIDCGAFKARPEP